MENTQLGNQSLPKENKFNIFLRAIEKNKDPKNYDTQIELLKEEAKTRGLEINTLKLIVKIIKNNSLANKKLTILIKCMIPRRNFPDELAAEIIKYFFHNIDNMTVSCAISIVEWLIGCWEYHIINRGFIYNYYDIFFLQMLKHNRLSVAIAQLIYIMTKPDDVARREILRILKVIASRKRMQKHLVAVLSLYKSYKPEVVPERVYTINVQSVWNQMSDFHRDCFEAARSRMSMSQTRNGEQRVSWAVLYSTNKRRKLEPIIPTVTYMNTDSNLFSTTLFKNVFEISNFQDLGKYQNIIKLPSNATSLLVNSIGYHLLTFTNHNYQYRFMHNLYYILWLSFIFESKKYPKEDMDKLLDMVIELTKYMQHGISMVHFFLHEYLSFYTNEYQDKILILLQFIPPSISILEDVFKHIKVLFYCSSLEQKCNIIKHLEKLLLNVSIKMDNQFKDKEFPFLGDSFTDNFLDIVSLIDKFSRELIVSGLNIHTNDIVFLSSAVSFYEQFNILQFYWMNPLVQIVPPQKLVYASFTSDCVIFDRVCNLLIPLIDHPNKSSDEYYTLISYAEDISSALWNGDFISGRSNTDREVFRTLKKRTIQRYSLHKFNSAYDICNNYIFLPFKIAIEKITNLKITSKMEALIITEHYFPNIKEFINIHLNDQSEDSDSDYSYPSS